MSVISLKTKQKYGTLLAGNAFFMPSAFESIATAYGTGSSATITFSALPSNYQYYQLRILAKSNFSSDTFSLFYLRVNGDSGSNYSEHYLRGSNLFGVTASGSASQTEISPSFWLALGGTALNNIYSPTIIDIYEPSSTTKNKTIRALSGADANNLTSNGNEGVSLNSGMWINTSAISSITLTANNGSFTTDSIFALYGIKGA